jgi:abortive infection bacteriophage resistance protein
MNTRLTFAKPPILPELQRMIKKAIAKRFDASPWHFHSWMHSISYLRNLCAGNNLEDIKNKCRPVRSGTDTPSHTW